jgi:hypothetical protein
VIVVKQHRVDTAAGQIDGNRQSDRSGPDDDYAVVGRPGSILIARAAVLELAHREPVG